MLLGTRHLRAQRRYLRLKRQNLRIAVSTYGDEGCGEVWSWYGLSACSICDSAVGGWTSTWDDGGGDGHGATIGCTEAQAFNRGNSSNRGNDRMFIGHLGKLSGDARDGL